MFNYRLFLYRVRVALQFGVCQAGLSLCKPRLVATLLAFLGLAMVCLAAYLIAPRPDKLSALKVGTVYMVSTGGRIRIGDFKGSPRFESGVFVWKDRRGMEYRTVAPVLFESR